MHVTNHQVMICFQTSYSEAMIIEQEDLVEGDWFEKPDYISINQISGCTVHSNREEAGDSQRLWKIVALPAVRTSWRYLDNT